MNQKINLIYKRLLNKYGPQGWWPVYSLRNTEGRDNRGYYNDIPVESGRVLTLLEKYEIAIGAILTQNTTWTNVEKALANLIKLKILDPELILHIDERELAGLIRSSGYYNQKAKKIKILTNFLFADKYFVNGYVPAREDLLGLWGIGMETADSILLYAYKIPFFVVDAYTKRIFGRLGFLIGTEHYEEISRLFTDNLERGHEVYQEYHALIVRHAKEYCNKNPDCEACFLNDSCLKHVR